MINKSSPVPLYYQIKEDILAQIERGELKSGDQVDSEFALMKKYDVSQITIRKALSELVTSGVLYRIRGKGTFVTAKRQQHTTSLRSFAEEMVSSGQKNVDTRVISIEEAVNERINNLMGIEPHAKTVKISRIRYCEGEPIGLQTSYIFLRNIAFEAYQTIYDLKSVYTFLEKYGRRPVHVKETYRATVINNKKTKEILKAAFDDPAFYVTRKGFDEVDNVFEYTESILLGNKYELVTELYHSK